MLSSTPVISRGFPAVFQWFQWFQCQEEQEKTQFKAKKMQTKASSTAVTRSCWDLFRFFLGGEPPWWVANYGSFSPLFFGGDSLWGVNWGRPRTRERALRSWRRPRRKRSRMWSTPPIWSWEMRMGDLWDRQILVLTVEIFHGLFPWKLSIFIHFRELITVDRIDPYFILR